MCVSSKDLPIKAKASNSEDGKISEKIGGDELSEKEENYIDDVCKRLGFTHQQLADAIGYKKQTISDASSKGVTAKLRHKIEEYLQKDKTSSIEAKLKDLGFTVDDLGLMIEELEELREFKRLLKKYAS